jgi:hypothetical protein
VPDVV